MLFAVCQKDQRKTTYAKAACRKAFITLNNFFWHIAKKDIFI
jgi:hypothetical protein